MNCKVLAIMLLGILLILLSQGALAGKWIADPWTDHNTHVVSTESTADTDIPKISVVDGNIFIIWWDMTNLSGDTDGNYDVFLKQQTTSSLDYNGNWSSLTNQLVSTETTALDNNNLYALTLVVNDDNIFVSWRDKTDFNGSGGSDNDRFLKFTSLTGDPLSWTDNNTHVISTESTAFSGFGKIMVDSTNIYTIWRDSTDFNNEGTDTDLFFKYKPLSELDVNGTWHAVDDDSNTYVVTWESTATTAFFDTAIDSTNIYLVYSEAADYNSSGDDRDIFFKYKPISELGTDNNWSMAAEVVSSQSDKNSHYPQITLDSTNMYVVWRETPGGFGFSSSDSNVVFKYKPISTLGSDNSWLDGNIQVVSTESTNLSSTPDVAVDANKVYVTWMDGSNYNGAGLDFDIFFKSQPISALDFNGQWNNYSTTVVSTESDLNSQQPYMALDSNNIYISWYDDSQYAEAIDGGVTPDAFLKFAYKQVFDNNAPDVNVAGIDGFDDAFALPVFSYTVNGDLTIDFNIFDVDSNSLLIDINYSSSNVEGDGTVIVDDLNSLDSLANCESGALSTVRACSVVFGIASGVLDGNYFIIVKVYDETLSDFNASDNNFMITTVVVPPSGAVCGDLICAPSEDACSCPSDCSPVCGDLCCTGTESAFNCAADCSLCGDGACTGNEGPDTCPQDCVGVDLVVSSFSASSTVVKQGDPLTLTAVVENQGVADSGQFSVSLYVGSTDSMAIASVGVPSVSPGLVSDENVSVSGVGLPGFFTGLASLLSSLWQPEIHLASSETVNFTVDTSSLGGVVSFVVFVDSGREVAEDDESNNTAVVSVRITTEEIPSIPPGGVTPDDSDGDGLTDIVEQEETLTDYLDPDTDGDLVSDGQEVLYDNTDPLDAGSNLLQLVYRKELLVGDLQEVKVVHPSLGPLRFVDVNISFAEAVVGLSTGEEGVAVFRTRDVGLHGVVAFRRNLRLAGEFASLDLVRFLSVSVSNLLEFLFGPAAAKAPWLVLLLLILCAGAAYLAYQNSRYLFKEKPRTSRELRVVRAERIALAGVAFFLPIVVNAFAGLEVALGFALIEIMGILLSGFLYKKIVSKKKPIRV